MENHSMSHKVFVYGSLKQGLGNHHVLYRSEHDTKMLSLTVYTDDNHYHLYSLGRFPALCKNGYARIFGELYEVNDETMKHLDLLEGNGHLYQRELINVVDENGVVHSAWAYFLLLENKQNFQNMFYHFMNDQRVSLTFLNDCFYHTWSPEF